MAKITMPNLQVKFIGSNPQEDMSDAVVGFNFQSDYASMFNEYEDLVTGIKKNAESKILELKAKKDALLIETQRPDSFAQTFKENRFLLMTQKTDLATEDTIKFINDQMAEQSKKIDQIEKVRVKTQDSVESLLFKNVQEIHSGVEVNTNYPLHNKTFYLVSTWDSSNPKPRHDNYVSFRSHDEAMRVIYNQSDAMPIKFYAFTDCGMPNCYKMQCQYPGK